MKTYCICSQARSYQATYKRIVGDFVDDILARILYVYCLYEALTGPVAVGGREGVGVGVGVANGGRASVSRWN